MRSLTYTVLQTRTKRYKSFPTVSMIAIENPRPPFPPFNAESAVQKVRIAEDAWNTRDPERVSLAYTPDSVWRNRSEFLSGRDSIVQFLIPFPINNR
jgi:hypothetical protein